jgi:hypothetical protein
MKKLLLVCAFLAMSPLAIAQAPGDITFGATVTNANGSLSTTVNWSTAPVATSCTASGHASWTGTKAASGSLALPVITLSGTYPLTLTCTWPGDTTATLSWTRPTTNTDGSALAVCAAGVTSGPCLSGYRVYRRVGSTDMSGAEMTPVAGGATATRAFPGLGAGVHNFGVEAVNADGVPSVMSNIASKTIVASASRSASVTLTVNPKPAAPTSLTVE